jgi:hypothetical protein
MDLNDSCLITRICKAINAAMQRLGCGTSYWLLKLLGPRPISPFSHWVWNEMHAITLGWLNACYHPGMVE